MEEENEGWEAAKNHLDEISQAIEDTRGMPRVSMVFYETQYKGLRERYNSGERTEELYDEIMEFSL